MKLVLKNFANKIAGALLLAMVSQCIVGCNKNDDSSHIDQGSIGKVTVRFGGIQELEVGTDASNGAKANIKRNVKPIVQTYSEFDAILTVEKNAQTNTLGRQRLSNASLSSRGVKAAAMENNVYYRMFLFKADGTFVSSTLLNSSTAGSLDIQAGQSYKWYALSYNSSQTVPDLQSGSNLLQLPKGKDVLHAAGEFSVPNPISGPIGLNVVFKRKTARIDVTLNSKGMFGVMNSGTVVVSGLSAKTGTIDIFTGKWSDLKDSTQTYSFSSFTNVVQDSADVKRISIYTVDSVNANNVTVSVAGLNLTHADGEVRQFSNTAVTFPAVSVTPVIGSKNNVLFDLVESPLTVTYNGSTVRWARSNLYYQAGANPYRFYGTNTLNAATDGRGYFAFGGTLPRILPTPASMGDPCALVYPQGVWRQPTHDEFAHLTSGDGLLANVLGILGTAPAENYDGTEATGDGTYINYKVNAGSGNPAFGASSNALRFYYNGQVSGLSVLTYNSETGVIDLSLGSSHSSHAALWTSEGNISIPILLTGVGSWGYHARNRTGLTGAYRSAQGTAELLNNIQLLGIGVLSSSLKNVRCIRN